MYKNLLITGISVFVILFAVTSLHRPKPVNLKLEKLKQAYSIKPVSSVDHSKFPMLQKKFKTAQEVTEACITCHTERHKEIMASSHWNWERAAYVEGKGLTFVGKKNVINNFCIGASSNEQACAKCHIGFGMSNDKYDFKNARNVDCMVCHDNSDEYMKGSALAGYPARTVNLTKVARSVGAPNKHNCGSCHFYSGGGNNVKHGDLEESLLACTKDVDVHMAANGMDMECTACHNGKNHNIAGRLYSVSSTNTNRATCEQCHTNTPHFSKLLNQHGGKIACQTCHIPTYAKVNATKMAWKWSEAGRLKDGKPYTVDDSLGNHTYFSNKGEFRWEKNVTPDYIWFNGTADHYAVGDTISEIPVQVNKLNGNYNDPNAKIIPVKIHRGDQIYDKKQKMLIQPKLYSKHKGDSAFWKDFDWNLAAAAGMKRVGLEYSGNYGFVETEMYWPVNHMVAPKEASVSCAECHTRSQQGRLAQLSGFYLPGRDSNSMLDKLGRILVILSLVGVAIHAAMRIISGIKNEEYETDIISYEENS